MTADTHAPLLAPASLGSSAGVLWAIADRTVWAFGTPLARVPGFRWWRLPSAVLHWAQMRGHQNEFAGASHAHLRVGDLTGAGAPGSTPRQNRIAAVSITAVWIFGVIAILFAAAAAAAFA